MEIHSVNRIALPRVIIMALCAFISARAQGGKELLQWIQEFSPTGYFIIHDYETRANKPGAHKQFIASTTAPVPGTPVHETCHMLNGFNGSGNTHAYHVGGGKTLKVTPNFTPFTSDKMIPDIAQQFRNFQYDTYINNPGAYSCAGGLYGIFEEYSAYATENRASIEMVPCFKANFNTTANWDAFANDEYSTIMSQSEFRYFCLRYMLYAKKSNVAVYNAVLASQDTKNIYAALAQYSSQNAKDWEAAMKAQGRNTTTSDGWGDYWLFFKELQKQEYVDMEALMMQGVVDIAARPDPEGTGLARFWGRDVVVSAFDPRGVLLASSRLRGLDAGGYRGLVRDWGRRFPPATLLRIGAGGETASDKLRSYSTGP